MSQVTFSEETLLQLRPAAELLITQAELFSVPAGHALEVTKITGEKEQGLRGLFLEADLNGFSFAYAPDGSFEGGEDVVAEAGAASQQINEAGKALMIEARPEKADDYDIAPDVEAIEAGLGRLLTVELEPNQYSAIAAWAFDVGLLYAEKSAIIKLVNAGELEAVAIQIRGDILTLKGRQLPYIEEQRKAQYELFTKKAETEELSVEQVVEPVQPGDPSQLASAQNLEQAIAPVQPGDLGQPAVAQNLEQTVVPVQPGTPGQPAVAQNLEQAVAPVDPVAERATPSAKPVRKNEAAKPAAQ